MNCPTGHTAIDIGERFSAYIESLNVPVGQYYFSTSETEGLLFQREHNYCERILDGSKSLEDALYVPRRYFNVCRLHGDYALLIRDDEASALEYTARCAAYAHTALKLCLLGSECFPSVQPLTQEMLFEYLSYLLLSGWEEETADAFEALYRSMKEGKSEPCLQSESGMMEGICEFVLILYANSRGMEYQTSASGSSPDGMLYRNIAKAWDGTNPALVDSHVSLLCESRLELYRLGSYFRTDTALLSPVEVFAWLALRKKAGLENPKKFSHPLMNTPLAKMFLELQTPLPEPDKLPYAEALIAKLVENCPKMAGEAESEDKTPISPPEPKTAPKTGRYRATLIEGHPQYEALKIDPLAYRTYKEGERFSNAGLEEYEADKIEWVFVE